MHFVVIVWNVGERKQRAVQSHGSKSSACCRKAERKVESSLLDSVLMGRCDGELKETSSTIGVNLQVFVSYTRCSQGKKISQINNTSPLNTARQELFERLGSIHA